MLIAHGIRIADYRFFRFEIRSVNTVAIVVAVFEWVILDLHKQILRWRVDFLEGIAQVAIDLAVESIEQQRQSY